MVANKMNEGYLRPIAYYADGLMGVGAVNPVRLSVALVLGRVPGE